MAIAKLVTDPTILSFVSSVGSDHNAQIIMDTLDRYHMTKESLIVNSAYSTGLTNICIDQNGERAESFPESDKDFRCLWQTDVLS